MTERQESQLWNSLGANPHANAAVLQDAAQTNGLRDGVLALDRRLAFSRVLPWACNQTAGSFRSFKPVYLPPEGGTDVNKPQTHIPAPARRRFTPVPSQLGSPAGLRSSRPLLRLQLALEALRACDHDDSELARPFFAGELRR